MPQELEIYRTELGTPPSRESIEHWIGKAPGSINIDGVDVCNLRCPHCALPAQTERRKESVARGEHVHPPFIDTSILIAAYDDIKRTWASELPAIQITANGEPLMHPDHKLIVQYPASLGFRVGLTTNGVLLKPQLVEDFCRAGVSMINVSLDAAQADTYAIVRPSVTGRNHFDRVVDNIRNAVAVRDKLSAPTKIMMNMIIRPVTAGDQDAFVELARELGVDRVSMRPLNSNAGLTEEQGISDVTTRNGVVTHVNGEQRWPCHFPFTRMNFSPADNGSIRMTYCPHGWDRSDFDIGYYTRDSSVDEIWNSPQFLAIREAHLLQTISPDSPCATCTDWYLVTREGGTQATYAQIMGAGETSKPTE